MKRLWLLFLFLAAAILAVYLWPVPRPAFDEIYSAVPASTRASLQSFRAAHPPAHLTVSGQDWEYLALGQGPKTIVFLHGMTGAYDIWWQQLEALQSEYRLIAVTYPPAASLAEMETGLLAVLSQEKIDRFSVVGSSLGGYFAQYLVSRHSDRIEKAVFANTFAPNDLLEQQNGLAGKAVPYLPNWLVMQILRGSFAGSIYPASGSDPLTLAFLNEIAYGRVSKAQVYTRYRCVVEKFTPAAAPALPLLIIEASNDPLVEASLRQQLRQTYPAAQVVTVENGHFPYLSQPEVYTRILQDFLQ